MRFLSLFTLVGCGRTFELIGDPDVAAPEPDMVGPETASEVGDLDVDLTFDGVGCGDARVSTVELEVLDGGMIVTELAAPCVDDLTWFGAPAGAFELRAVGEGPGGLWEGAATYTLQGGGDVAVQVELACMDGACVPA